MRGQDRVRRRKQPRCGREGFGLEDIEPGAADVALLQQLDEDVLFEHPASRYVDQGRTHREEEQFAPPDQASRLLGERDVQAQDVARRQQFVERGTPNDAVRHRGGDGVVDPDPSNQVLQEAGGHGSDAAASPG